MTLTEKEIMSQHEALHKTLAQLDAQADEIAGFFTRHSAHKFAFVGCGSSFMLAKSCAAQFGAYAGVEAFAFAGGDYLLNADSYVERLRGAVLVMLSRSGQTSEMLICARRISESVAAPLLAITMKGDSELALMAELSIALPWAYDKSVCQTRCVTNLYVAGMLLCAKVMGDSRLDLEARAAIAQNEAFMLEQRAVLEAIGEREFTNAVVLAGGPLCGLAEEAALAFTEIAQIPGKYFGSLDFRHGPMVLLSPLTLVIMALSPNDPEYQRAMIADLRARGAYVLTLGDSSQATLGADANIGIHGVKYGAAWGPFLAYCAQMIALTKALRTGVDPDNPTGLDAFITLK